MKEYTDYMTVTDSNYGKELRDSFNSGKAPESGGNWVAKGISSFLYCFLACITLSFSSEI